MKVLVLLRQSPSKVFHSIQKQLIRLTEFVLTYVPQLIAFLSPGWGAVRKTEVSESGQWRRLLLPLCPLSPCTTTVTSNSRLLTLFSWKARDWDRQATWEETFFFFLSRQEDYTSSADWKQPCDYRPTIPPSHVVPSSLPQTSQGDFFQGPKAAVCYFLQVPALDIERVCALESNMLCLWGWCGPSAKL